MSHQYIAIKSEQFIHLHLFASIFIDIDLCCRETMMFPTSDFIHTYNRMLCSCRSRKSSRIILSSSSSAIASVHYLHRVIPFKVHDDIYASQTKVTWALMIIQDEYSTEVRFLYQRHPSYTCRSMKRYHAKTVNFVLLSNLDNLPIASMRKAIFSRIPLSM
jgi:hypothetical protein